MVSRVMLFTGAPPASSLTRESCTLKNFNKPFAEFLDLPQSQSPASLTTEYAAWRSLPLTRQPLHTGFSQAHDLTTTKVLNKNPDFFTTAEVSFNDQAESFESEEAGDILSRFYEHSLAIHNPIPSSILDSFEGTSLSLEETSFMTTSSAGKLPDTLSLPSRLSDLKDVPSARRIIALTPQTVTLNLIVGIISIAQPRVVTTKWGKRLSLVEILVGDETKSGFAVTFWINDGAEGPISHLRRQDVVSLQNVALHVFRGKVYGQSLRRGLTKVNLLWRRDGTGLYSLRDLAKRGRLNPQVAKTRIVKDWVLKFVGGQSTATTTKTAPNIWDKPPDDTQ